MAANLDQNLTTIRSGLKFDILMFSVSLLQDRAVLLSSNRWLIEFLGANILDERPFIVMPFLKHGNCRDYLKQHPNSHRLQIVRSSRIPVLPDCNVTFTDI